MRYALGIAALHALGAALLLASLPSAPALLGLAALAYTLGLRHAFDIDHIAAIDNVIRTLIAAGHRTAGVGFFFALGHSTVVLLLSVAVAFATRWITSTFPTMFRTWRH